MPPFYKWLGGKRRIMDWILPELRLTPNSRYVEPFFGGGACFFAVRAGGFAGPAIINDLCHPLTVTLWAVQQDPEAVLAEFRKYTEKDSGELYYSVRKHPPEDPIQRAGWFLYLNKAGYNGLWRENRKGENNVPYGDGRPPTVIAEALRDASLELRNTEIRCGDFEDLEADLGPGDVVYLDPPYLPLTLTASFTTYVAGGFSAGDQLRLAEFAKRGSQRGARLVISNAGNEDSVACYAAIADRVVKIPAAPRTVSCKGNNRKPVSEYLFILEGK